ncbi:hypothetical protein BDV11DRAFT_122585 [Aspergillus similis]
MERWRNVRQRQGTGHIVHAPAHLVLAGWSNDGTAMQVATGMRIYTVYYCQDKIRRSLFDIKVPIAYLLPSDDIDSLEKAQGRLTVLQATSAARLSLQMTPQDR